VDPETSFLSGNKSLLGLFYGFNFSRKNLFKNLFFSGKKKGFWS
jgi:hypothetical protein